MGLIVGTAKGALTAFITYLTIHATFFALDQVVEHLAVKNQGPLKFLLEFHDWLSVLVLASSWILVTWAEWRSTWRRIGQQQEEG